MGKWLYVLSVSVFLVLLIFGKGWRGAKALVQFLWSAIVAVYLSGVAFIAVCQGEYLKAGSEFVLLLLILMLTGIIPKVMIHLRKSKPLRAKRPPPRK